MNNKIKWADLWSCRPEYINLLNEASKDKKHNLELMDDFQRHRGPFAVYPINFPAALLVNRLESKIVAEQRCQSDSLGIVSFFCKR